LNPGALIRQLLPSTAVLSGDQDLEEFYALPPARSLRADFVVSIDGAVEIEGKSRGLGGPADRAAFMAMRAVADAVLVGAGTARIERYGPVALSEAVEQRRLARGQEPAPPLVVVSRRGLLGSDDRVFLNGYRPMVVTTAAALQEHPELEDLAHVIVCGEDEVDLPKSIDHLVGMGYERLLCEGGPALLHSLLSHDLVDEMCVTFSPVIAGAHHLLLSGDRPLGQPSRFRLEGLLEGDGLLLARYGRDGDQR